MKEANKTFKANIRAAREARRTTALRANLLRRKVQQRKKNAQKVESAS